MKRLCVFCGSSVGARADYVEAARALASELARRGIGLVYGGGAIGIMGALADAALAAGVEVIGVIPRPLASRELAHRGLTELRWRRRSRSSRGRSSASTPSRSARSTRPATGTRCSAC